MPGACRRLREGEEEGAPQEGDVVELEVARAIDYVRPHAPAWPMPQAGADEERGGPVKLEGHGILDPLDAVAGLDFLKRQAPRESGLCWGCG